MSFPVAAITDEFSPDLETAVSAMAGIGMRGAELRVVYGKNILDLSDSELDSAIQTVRSAGLEIVSIASPLLKCVLPDAPAVDERFQQDVFASAHTFEDQPRLATRAFEVAKRAGAKIIRVFSFWRTVEPEVCFERILDALRNLADQAADRDLTIGLENEHACNIGTGREAAAVLRAIRSKNLGLVWDPANALVAGETPFPDGYRLLPPERVVHVHAKDCTVQDHRATWLALGTGAVAWQMQVEALRQDGYKGWLSLETHWPGPNKDKLEASTICGRSLMALAGE